MLTRLDKLEKPKQDHDKSLGSQKSSSELQDISKLELIA